MSHENIIRAWKDEEFRNSLSEKERALLPENPVGLVELTNNELGNVSGGRRNDDTLGGSYDCTYICCVTVKRQDPL
ncbi:mersacidin/lichenicidin family type 2 lantibiotic [Synechocystis sp. PCC 7509]|uniref:mersacidin/lichenicidin family type 2 lantibiotic n=1 Tax=Synechocystis sp. PCC 7509 TaxID=927677 RepID=UPI0002ABAE5A|nr:mersacidin/lichenicidin family type 2 lantibiotic [Synechocystis sp. PCC 7509]